MFNTPLCCLGSSKNNGNNRCGSGEPLFTLTVELTMNNMQKINKKQSGFTLLELLVVVGIIAIIGGAMISSFAGNEAKAARGVATQSIAGVENSIRIFVNTNDTLPNNLESLVCAPYSATGDVNTAAWAALAETDPKAAAAILATTAEVTVGATAAGTTAYKFGGISNVSGIGGGMGKKLADKFVGTDLTAAEVTEFTDRGLLTLRYAIAEACDDDIATAAALTDVNGATGAFGDTTDTLANIDIPNQAFSDPRPDGATAFKFRGVGFEGNVALAAPVLMWYKGSDVTAAAGAVTANGYNNVKIGAGAHDRILAFGIGGDSDLVGPNAVFGKAPFYGQVGKDKYAHYIGLFNTGTYTHNGTAWDEPTSSSVNIQAVIDARGDFLDEEFAEFAGQKT
jgi:prepilin-type N-terminal cleavage/methylation domain-containing protein